MVISGDKKKYKRVLQPRTTTKQDIYALRGKMIRDVSLESLKPFFDRAYYSWNDRR